MAVETPCREWQGTRVKAGYGHRYVNGTPGTLIRNEKQQIIGHEGNVRGHYEYLHRWVWEQVNGPIPKGMSVLHRCDNPPCFRYDHLFLGDHRANSLDMMAKGRGRGQFQKRSV